MKNQLLEQKKVDVISYLTKKELSVEFPQLNTFPSVTSVLKDKKEEEVFRKLLKNPNSALSKATKAGTAAHKAIETGEAKDALSEAVLTTFSNNIACDIDEVYGLEEWLCHSSGYKGKFDGCGIYQGKVTLFDYKKTNKRKTPSTMKKYFSQLMAYKQAHEFLYPQLKIEQVAIFNIFGKKVEEVDTKVTILTIDEMKHYLNVFQNRLNETTI